MRAVKWFQVLVAAVLCGLLAACAAPRQGAPVYDQSGRQVPQPENIPQPEASPQSEAIPQAADPGSRVVLAAPAPARPTAVWRLLETARQQEGAGDHAAAAATLERALRIAPKDALLWHELASVRLTQGRWQLAEQMAAKSNNLARNEQQLIAANWRLIASARQSRGDSAGARRAREQAQQASE
jgi:tetratricopeptide (TPR) repeat protein